MRAPALLRARSQAVISALSTSGSLMRRAGCGANGLGAAARGANSANTRRIFDCGGEPSPHRTPHSAGCCGCRADDLQLGKQIIGGGGVTRDGGASRMSNPSVAAPPAFLAGGGEIG